MSQTLSQNEIKRPDIRISNAQFVDFVCDYLNGSLDDPSKIRLGQAFINKFFPSNGDFRDPDLFFQIENGLSIAHIAMYYLDE